MSKIKIVQSNILVDNDGNKWEIEVNDVGEVLEVSFRNIAGGFPECYMDMSLFEAIVEKAKEIQFIVHAMSIKEE